MTQLGPHERHDVANDVVEVYRILAWRTLTCQLADPLNHLPRPVAVSHDGVKRPPHALEVGRRGGEPVQGGVGIGDDGRERLVHLVGDGRGHLAQHGNAGDVGELGVGLRGPLLGVLALGHVDHGDQQPLEPFRGRREGDGEQGGQLAALKILQGDLPLAGGPALGDVDQQVDEGGPRFGSPELVERGQQIGLALRAEHLHRFLVDVEDAHEAVKAADHVPMRGEVLAEIAHALSLQLVDHGFGPGEILLPDRDPGGFEDRAVALLALAQPAEHRQARQGIRKPPADRLEEDLLAPRPDARVRALAESEHVREIALGVQRHDDPRLDAEELPLLGRQRML